MVNEPSVYEPLKFYCILVYFFFFFQIIFFKIYKKKAKMKSKAHGYEGHLLLSFISSDHMMSTRVLSPGIDSLVPEEKAYEDIITKACP